MMTMDLRSAACLFAACWIAASTAGCSPIPRLDDARLTSVGTATTADQTRLSEAKEQFARKSFGGVTVQDRQRGRLVFSDYDAYQAYKHDHPELTSPLGYRADWPWPILRVVFSTSRVLLEGDDPDFSRSGQLSFCSGASIGSGELLWQSRVVTRDVADQIEAAAAAAPQIYEVFIPYTHATNVVADDLAVMLLPPTGDLCLSIRSWANWPAESNAGISLRIPKESVASALGTLPRRLEPRLGTAP